MPSIRSRLRSAFRRPTDTAEDLLTGPIQGDLLGAEHLAERARVVARGQTVASPPQKGRRARLLARLDSTRKLIDSAYSRIARDTANGGEPDPAGEWLLDNYHVILEHMQEVREALPRGFYRELPELANGPLTGYPRVYEVAIALISHSEGRIDLDNVDLFVQAYQEVEPLSIGELWAIPAMLRLGLIENVRRMTLRTVQRLDQIAAADQWAARIQEASERSGAALANALRDVVDTRQQLTPIFVSHFLAQLRLAAGASSALAWLERWMHDEQWRPDDATARATQRVAHTQMIMANSITSLRTIGRRDWRRFVEGQSAMESVLRTDPSGHYGRMTFGTRDEYRHAVERIAKRSGIPEPRVAELAVGLAAAVPVDDAEAARRRHVGYYLIDDGLGDLERAAGSVPAFAERALRTTRKYADLVLLGGLGLLTALALVAVLWLAGVDALHVVLPLMVIFTFLPAWDIGISAANQLVTAVIPPRVLPSLDFREIGVPQEYQTAVVVPTLFGSEADVRGALENLEVLYLANRDGSLHFAILSDFTDAPTEVTPEDEGILAAAVAGIQALNERYAEGGIEEFSLLHRPRRWNDQQGVWMGWERKRGKLAEFNRFLRTGSQAPFNMVSGDLAPLRDVRYVITLDADTHLPQGAAAALIGTIAHPLNRAVYDPHLGRIVAGYGILQPRVGVALPSAQQSRFAAIHSGQPGVDPYTTAVSDVYQDLYGEGSFTGKGIYDVDAFREATHGRFPENTLLSHDLIEGNYARAGLATGIIVYDDYPSSYVAHARRKHRWIRGDWQLLPWLAPRVPGPDGPEPNRLAMVSRWKILDNLRRSTVEIAQLALIFAGWTVFGGSPIRWTLLGLGAIAAPWIVSLLLAAVRPPGDKSWRAYYAAIGRDAVNGSKQVGLALTFLPHQAWLSADAIGRTLIRLFFTRRHLLEWQPAAQVARRLAGTGTENWRAMRPAIVACLLIALTITGVAIQRGSGAVPWALMFAVWPMTILWLLSPLIATGLGRPVATGDRLAEAMRRTAQRYAEQHWKFFDRYVTAETHWLAPDNVQFDPTEVVAMRTSPTNIGLQLLTTVSAHDLGVLSLEEMTHRLERTFETLGRLPRYRGHFYNWYSLDDLHVLEPAYVSTVDSGNLAGHFLALRQACLALAERPASDVESAMAVPRERLHQLAERAYQLTMAMEFGFLFDAPTRLFAIGYHPESHTLDASSYDLLASEARLAAFVAIAKGDVPVEAWFRLGRSLIRRDGVPMMVSWSGSMFEYLMPLLVMESFPGTLLDQSDRGAVRAQIAYGHERGVPWGVSESAYNVRDQHLTYQYRAFGVPELALKRDLGRDLVVAPYASALSAMLMPVPALANLAALEALNALGPHGFWDAIDFTRPMPGERFAMVKTVMAHHAGMTIVALTNLLHHDIWQTRFHNESMVRAAELLLQERVPRRLVVQEAAGKRSDEASRDLVEEPTVVRHVNLPESPQPRVALLGDLPYTVMVTHAGGGFSRYQSLAVTRWHADGTADDTGQFCYVRDVTAGRTWSVGYQPTGAEADTYHAHFAPDRATLHRMDGEVETRTEIVVVPADAAEVRRVTLTNYGSEAREIELTTYGEVVMGPAEQAAAHPAFANLFVETEWHEWCASITARRRPRRADEQAPWCVHLVDAGADRVGPVTCETDRARFVGRGRTTRHPIAMDQAGPLSGTTGAVLDPIIALRTRVRVGAGKSVSVAFTTLVAATREAAFDLADRYHAPHAARRALDLAWMVTQIDLRHAGIDSGQAAVFQDIAGHLLYAREALGPPADELRRNRGSQPRLWTHGISGDWPILLAVIDAVKGLPTLRELFAAHRYWRRHGLSIDLVVVIAHPHDYLQELRQSITEELFAASGSTVVDQPGGVFIRRRDTFNPDDYLMLSATARVHIPCDGRPLSRIVPGAITRSRAGAPDTMRPAPAELRVRPRPPRLMAIPASDAEPVAGENGFGGLDEAGDYVLRVAEGHVPPAPWSNVIANPHGGFLVTERGAGCTWAESSYFFRLTPWHNDPVTDPVCDVIYLKDDESGELWSATPAPVPAAGSWMVRHGPGQSTFAHDHQGIETELTLGLPTDAAVKLSLLRVTNRSERRRTLTLTAYAEWTLGIHRETTSHHLQTQFVAEHAAILARNSFDPDFSGHVAFLGVTASVESHTADRREFIGRHGDLADPAALRRETLSDHAGLGFDPCAALQFSMALEPGESREVAVVLGAAQSDAAARQTLARFGTAIAVRGAIDANVDAWEDRLGTITVRTPDPQLDVMLNRWTMYQALSSRMWARMGLYQSSGAYGFRDQLQDAMALVYAEPALARAHLLRAAARQFLEGDVQHWWHPHNGRGVRTRISDDLVWLPHAVDHYLRTTGDRSVLDESVPFLSMRPLQPGELEIYDAPEPSDERGTLYEHCLRALRRACTRGSHGLPLIGTGDWNDGFSRVGVDGRGESVWLAWFLIATCRRFAEQADLRGDAAAAEEMRGHADGYTAAVERHAWDGAWYRRAYYDDDTPLGSATSTECQIDAIAQSWSVISGAGSSTRQAQAMASVHEHLVNEEAGLVMLLTPPFDRGSHDPGYIKGYLPGVRENGAQYTHAALWTVQATALMGDGDRAHRLYRMLNPLTHTATAEGVAVYQVEPYVVAADVYTAPGHVGRGGWTWYTGSASWMYRVGLESLLGVTKRGDTLIIVPSVPVAWERFEIDYRFGGSLYAIRVERPAEIREHDADVTIDGVSMADGVIRLVDDGGRHEVVVAGRANARSKS